MKKMKTKREIGLKEYKLWKQSNLRGYRMIGQWIINRYGLLDEDLKMLKNEQHVNWNRIQRKKIKLKKEAKENKINGPD